MQRLKQRTAVVTGGSQGIGFAIAAAFAASGANLVLLARNPQQLGEARQALLAGGGTVAALPVDLSDLATLPDTVQQILALTGGRLDVLVNNVSVSHFKPLPELAPGMITEMIDLNLKVPLLLVQGLLPALTATAGCVINISSFWAEKMVSGRPSSAYSMTRAGLNALTRALAGELGDRQIRVNAIAPGTVQTPGMDKVFRTMSPEQLSEYQAYIKRTYPLGRIGVPEDVAGAAVYLASDEARWVTGTILQVDGGLSVR